MTPGRYAIFDLNYLCLDDDWDRICATVENKIGKWITLLDFEVYCFNTAYGAGTYNVVDCFNLAGLTRHELKSAPVMGTVDCDWGIFIIAPMTIAKQADQLNGDEFTSYAIEATGFIFNVTQQQLDHFEHRIVSQPFAEGNLELHSGDVKIGNMLVYTSDHENIMHKFYVKSIIPDSQLTRKITMWLALKVEYMLWQKNQSKRKKRIRKLKSKLRKINKLI